MPVNARRALAGMPAQLPLLMPVARTADNTNEFAVAANGAWDGQEIMVLIVESAHAATPSVVFNLQAYDEASDSWVTLLASAAVTTEGTTKMTYGPTAPVSANVSANGPIFPVMRIFADHSNTDSMTYSVSITAS